jgi:hypothetical protein
MGFQSGNFRYKLPKLGKKYFNTKLSEYQLKKQFSPTFVSTAQRFSSSIANQ